MNSTERNRSLLTGSVFELRQAELAGFRLRCGIWSTFALATVFVAAAKFYFGYRVSVSILKKNSYFKILSQNSDRCRNCHYFATLYFSVVFLLYFLIDSYLRTNRGLAWRYSCFAGYWYFCCPLVYTRSSASTIMKGITITIVGQSIMLVYRRIISLP